MPNGIDKNLVRLRMAVDRFRERFGRWPHRVVLHPLSLSDIRRLVTPEFMAAMEEKLQFVAGEAAFRCEDEDGRWYDYGQGRASEHARDPGSEDDDPELHSAAAWLGLDRWHEPPASGPTREGGH